LAKLPKTGYVDYIADFKYAVDYIRKKHPELTIFAIGHSYGANTLVNVPLFVQMQYSSTWDNTEIATLLRLQLQFQILSISRKLEPELGILCSING
jgi:Lysophospholipase